jgi:hypothetical protein
MPESLADWLALREAADFASRSKRLTRLVSEALAKRSPVRVLDLATGTGSNLRYLVPRLAAHHQEWTVVDREPAVLQQLQARTAAWAEPHAYRVFQEDTGFVVQGQQLACHVSPLQRNLSDLTDPALFANRDLITASALLDLVSESWLTSLAAACRETDTAALFTLTYDGRSPCAPADPDDELVRELFNQHQRTDKGLGGVAAGPDASEVAARAFANAGFRVDRERSDWVLEPTDAALQRELIKGWASAATEMAPEIKVQIDNWQLRRLQHVAHGNSLIIVGHEDLVAIP